MVKVQRRQLMVEVRHRVKMRRRQSVVEVRKERTTGKRQARHPVDVCVRV